MKRKFQIKPQSYGFPSNIGGMTIRTITWKDFPAKPPENTWFLAYTYWNTNWISTVKNGKGTVLPTVSIGPKAWTRALQDFRLLEHETGHYWIACQCALQFMKRINYTQKQPDDIKFGEWSQKVWKKTTSQYAQQQKRYDKQTYHYCIEEEQQRWMSQMIEKFNSYHKFFQEKKKQDQKRDGLIKAQLRQIVKNTSNQNQRVMKSVPITKKIPDVNNLRPNIRQKLGNQVQSKRKNKQFSVRKTNTIFNQRQPAKNVKVFQQAKNTILGNIQLLEGLK